MSSADLLLNLNEVSKAGNLVDASKIIEFLTDSGKSLGNCVKQVIRGANGTAQTVYTHIAESASGLATSGLSFLTMDVGLLGAALAPVLGVAGGLAISELISPGTTETVIEAFRDYGLTVGNEVVAYYDSTSGQVSVPENVINIYKEALIRDGVYDATLSSSSEIDLLNSFKIPNVGVHTFSNYKSVANAALDGVVSALIDAYPTIINSQYFNVALDMCRQKISEVPSGNYSIISVRTTINTPNNYIFGQGTPSKYCIFDVYFYTATQYPTYLDANPNTSTGGQLKICGLNMEKINVFDDSSPSSCESIIWGTTKGVDFQGYTINARSEEYGQSSEVSQWNNDYYSFNSLGEYVSCSYSYKSIYSTWVAGLCDFSSNAMDGAVLPVKDTPISTTYTGYNPLGLADWVTDIPSLYPIPVVQNPAMTQTQAWNPAYDDSLIDALAEAIVDAIVIPDIAVDVIVPPVVVDPDVPAVDDPIDLPIEGAVPLNPADPNLPSQKVPVPMLPVTPFTTESNAMFTVYNPTASQLNELGAFLWSNDILDQIVRIWTNPMEGIISLRKVYATPTCELSSPIQLGNLTTDIISKVVSNQFSTINCGTVKIPEIRKNATDYPPYTKVSIYLPFIGIMDLDTAEVMNSELTLYYHIDMYTGTCLAEIYVKRPDDFIEPQVLYTFTGNCSQSLPLTSQEASGLIGTLTSIATSGMMAAVAPSMVPFTVAGAASAMSSGQTSVLHSGALSSNAGIMGQRKPYIIVSRQQSYDANNYSELYGFPSNATVYLGNCSGYQKIRAIRLQSEATDEEKREIESLLYEGVIV